MTFTSKIAAGLLLGALVAGPGVALAEPGPGAEGTSAKPGRQIPPERKDPLRAFGENLGKTQDEVRVRVEAARQELRENRDAAKDIFKVNRDAVKDEFRASREAAREEFQAAREAAKEQFKATREDVRAAGGDPAALRQAMQLRRESLHNAFEERRESFRQDLEERKLEMRKLIEERKSALKEQLAAFKDARKAQVAERVDGNLAQINESRTAFFTAAVDRLDAVLVAIGTRADAAAGDGADVSEVEERIADAESALDEARAAIAAQAAQDYTVSVSDELTVRSDVESARDALRADLEAVRESVRAAHEAIREAARALKAATPDDSPDAPEDESGDDSATQ